MMRTTLPAFPDTALVGDIGGTHTRLCLVKQGKLGPSTMRKYVNAEWASFQEIVSAYCSTEQVGTLMIACIAAAGPVQDGRARLTNLDWHLGPDSIEGAKTIVVNDLMAAGFGIPSLGESDLRLIVQGNGPNPATQRNSLVVGLGTGFNSAFVHQIDQCDPVVFCAESGHASLPARCGVVREIGWAGSAHSVEEALSGRGLEKIYAGLSGNAGQKNTSAIFGEAKQDKFGVGAQSVAFFAETLAIVLQDLALCHLPNAGIYLIGGMSQAVAPFLGQEFGKRFREHAIMGHLLEQMSIQVVQSDNLGLAGAANVLMATSQMQEPVN